MEFDDDAALTNAAQGDIEAFGVLYERYVGRIYNYIYYRTGTQPTQRTSPPGSSTGRCVTSAAYHDRGLPLSAWLYRIAHNVLANWHRDNSRCKEVPLDETVTGKADGQYPEAELVQSEETEQLLTIIRCLATRAASSY